MSGSFGENRGSMPLGQPEKNPSETAVGDNDGRSSGAFETAVGDNDGRPSGELLVTPGVGELLPYDDGSASRDFVGIATGEQLDAFRELRTRLLAMGAGIGLHRFTVLVVPVASGSGADFIASNLAVAFTLQEQRRAVLIDCNLRKPTQHIAFDLPYDCDGLFDHLENPENPAEQLLYRTNLAGLYLIPAGRPLSSAREYFSLYAMRTLLTSLREPPCFLVLDGPPVMGSPDARILSELADFVVLVAGYGRDTVDGIAQAVAMFDPAKFAGVVFNDQD
jgi:Mrp family chromosome partitioning ATPase